MGITVNQLKSTNGRIISNISSTTLSNKVQKEFPTGTSLDVTVPFSIPKEFKKDLLVGLMGIYIILVE